MSTNLQDLSFDLASLRAAYAAGTPVRAVIAEAMRRCATDAHHAFIHRLTDGEWAATVRVPGQLDDKVEWQGNVAWLADPATAAWQLAVERIGSSSVTYRLGVFDDGAAEAAAEGHFTHVYVGRDSRRPVALPADWRAKIATLA